MNNSPRCPRCNLGTSEPDVLCWRCVAELNRKGREMGVGQQDEFDLLIGRLDRTLSQMMLAAKHHASMDEPNRQTLKHHAEDMILAGRSILKKMGFTEPEAK